MHMVASPYLPPVRFNSYSNLTYDRAGRADGMALFPGNGILCAETKATKHPEKFTESRGRDEAHVTSRPIRRQLPHGREISSEVGMRGGAGRTRTCRREIISLPLSVAFCADFPPLTKSPHRRFFDWTSRPRRACMRNRGHH
jgi:hypothetical protein